MALAAWLGALIGGARRIDAEAREQFGVVRTATLTLLALIIDGLEPLRSAEE